METIKALIVAVICAALLIGVMLVQPEVPDTDVCIGDTPTGIRQGSNVVYVDCGSRWDPMSRKVIR